MLSRVRKTSQKICRTKINKIQYLKSTDRLGGAENTPIAKLTALKEQTQKIKFVKYGGLSGYQETNLSLVVKYHCTF